jgi:hypothetical protein
VSCHGIGIWEVARAVGAVAVKIAAEGLNCFSWVSSHSIKETVAK